MLEIVKREAYRINDCVVAIQFVAGGSSSGGSSCSFEQAFSGRKHGGVNPSRSRRQGAFDRRILLQHALASDRRGGEGTEGGGLVVGACVSSSLYSFGSHTLRLGLRKFCEAYAGFGRQGKGCGRQGGEGMSLGP